LNYTNSLWGCLASFPAVFIASAWRTPATRTGLRTQPVDGVGFKALVPDGSMLSNALHFHTCKSGCDYLAMINSRALTVFQF
jgi:hypothetical protein